MDDACCLLLDTSQGWSDAMGFVRRISARGDPVEPRIADILVDDDWPQFLHPCSVSDKCFLIACRPDAKSEGGIYLAYPSWQRVFNVGFRVVCEEVAAGQ